MLRLTSVKIQDNVNLRSALAEKKIAPSELSIGRVIHEDEAGKALDSLIHEKMIEALTSVMEAKAKFAQDNGGSYDNELQAQMNNIHSFRLDAGGGFTTLRKAQLVEETSLVAEDFVPPKKGGGNTSGAVAVTGALDLSEL